MAKAGMKCGLRKSFYEAVKGLATLIGVLGKGADSHLFLDYRTAYA